MPEDDFVCAGMRQFLSVFRQRSSETCLSCLEQFSHGFDLVLFEFACFVAADEDFEHGVAVRLMKLSEQVSLPINGRSKR